MNSTVATLIVSSPDGETKEIRSVDEKFWERDGPIEASEYFYVEDEDLARKRASGEIIYHYTTLDSLQGIVDSKALWASDIRQLNDRFELKYALDQLRDLLANDTSITFDVSLLDSIFKPGRTWQFISCFSKARDQLSQWRAYGQKIGISIAFERAHLLGSAANSGGTLAECRYLSEDEFSTVRTELDPLVNLLHAPGTLDSYQGITSAKLKGELSTLAVEIACTIKHPSFLEESEVRFVLSASKAKEPVRFRSSENSLIPYHAINLDSRKDRNGARNRFANFLGMREIVVWPNNVDSQVLDAIDMLIADVGHIPIRRSSSPYRT